MIVNDRCCKEEIGRVVDLSGKLPDDLLQRMKPAEDITNAWRSPVMKKGKEENRKKQRQEERNKENKNTRWLEERKT